MAFQVTETQILQSALKAAAQVTAAMITVGDEDTTADPAGALDDLTNSLFNKLKEVADRDNEMLRKEDSSGGSGSARKGGTRTKGSRGGGGGQNAADIKLTWGAFKGLTIAEVYELSEDEAADYGYESGSGRKYINWLKNNKQNQFMADKAAEFLDSVRDAA